MVPEAELLLNAYAQPRHERLEAYAGYLAESYDTRGRGGILACYGPAVLSPTGKVPATTKTLAARITLALDDYRAEEGTLPKTLDELVPDYIGAIPEDLFLGQTFEYVREEPDYALYPDGLDDVLKPSRLTFAIHWEPEDVHESHLQK